MKRGFSIALCLLLVISLLSGCSGTKEFTKEGLTLTLPGSFRDLSGEDYAQAVTLLYGSGDLAILGIKEDKALLAQHGLELTLEEYGQLVIEANQVDAHLEQTDGFYTFTYEAAAEGISCTYLSLVLEGEDCYWTLQAYCPTEVFSANRDTMWSYLTSARIDK